ncbi:MAG: right-handed parallel beta-helix repeat-containing protein, partial [Rhodothermales bacterium]
MYTLYRNPEDTCPRHSRMLLLATLVILFMAGDAVAQTVAGPDANPLPRMNCPTAGEIRNDSGNCVPVASYFSTASNKIKWVDGTNGSDSNAGTQSNPWKTISRSTGEGVLQPGDAVIIRGGTYRESIAPQEAGVAGKQIAFVAFPGEKVVITGADPMNGGWTQSGNAWRHTWTESMPAEPNVGTLEERPEFRREMVIIDGQVLTPVFARSSVVPGTFYVEGTDVDPEAIYMRLPDDDSPSGHSVEVGYRSALFLPHGSREDWCGNNYGHYRLVGLTFRHAVNNASWAAVCTGKASLLEENTIEWTNGSGIYVAGSNNVLRGNRADYNGMRGIGGRCASCLLEYNETSYNNWKKHAYGYGAAGIKLIYSTQTVIGHHLSVGNDGVGIWYDVNNEDCVIESSVSMWNAGRGIMLEHGTVRTVVRNNVVYGTKLHPKEGTGIQTQAASHNTIVHNTIIGNEGYGIYIRVSPRNEDGYNKIYNNLLINNAAGGKSGHSEIRIDGIDLAHARTNDLDGNLYWPHAGISGSTFNFKTDAGDSFQGNSIDKWRTLIQGDAGASVLNDDVKQIEDMGSWSGWGLVTSSEAIGRGVALPSGIEVPIDIEIQDRPSILADVGADQYAESDGGGVIEGTLVENGSISFVQSSPDEWHTVKLKSVFVSPVVVMSPPSYNGGN